MDFFTVPTLTFGVLYCFFVIGHDSRRILHCNVTGQPNALWIVLRLREAWGYEQPHRYLIFDRDAKLSADLVSSVRDSDTSNRSELFFAVPGRTGSLSTVAA
jgi:hypothetical protein